MREAITIEYIVLLMTYSHPAVLVVLHASLRDPSVLLRLRLGEVAVHMIPSPIHFLAYTRPFRPGVEPRGSAGGSNYNSRFAYDFCRGGGNTILSRKELSYKLRFSVETPRPMCTKGGLGFGLVKN